MLAPIRSTAINATIEKVIPAVIFHRVVYNGKCHEKQRRKRKTGTEHERRQGRDQPALLFF